MEAETQRLLRTLRRTAIGCAIGCVLAALLFECWVGDGEAVFAVLVFSPLLALIGGMLGLFIGGWITALGQAVSQPNSDD
jgi:hypothetical protein